MKGWFGKLLQTLFVMLVVLVPAGLLGGGCVWLLVGFSDGSIHWVLRLTVGLMAWSALVLIGYGTLKACWLAWLRIGQIWRPPPKERGHE
jgi:hypothetical protein